jgi:hypothetical protein
MSQHTHWIAALVFVFLAALHAIANAADEDAKKLTDNTNSLIKEYRGKLKFSCSSFWPKWGPERAFDGMPLTSWFTDRGDAAAFGKKPWIAVAFPQAVTVRRVTLLSNREPPWQTGYTILVGRLELLDEKDRVLFTRYSEADAVYGEIVVFRRWTTIGKFSV